jgi:uncharacterized protein YdcH (DUF465 family)
MYIIVRCCHCAILASAHQTHCIDKETSMSVEHHDLIHEFPELKDKIHELKMGDHHFRGLFEEYHKLTRSIENMENEVTPVATHTEEEAKARRVYLKDELYRLLTAA